jgi:hypothetical protein
MQWLSATGESSCSETSALRDGRYYSAGQVLALSGHRAIPDLLPYALKSEHASNGGLLVGEARVI